MADTPVTPQVKPAAQAANPTTAPSPTPAPAGLDPELQKLIKEVLDLKAKVDSKPAPAKAAPAKQADAIDWTKITEADIANLNINIPVIEQETPEYLTVHLKDQNYIPRWVHSMRERLGPCLASGYEYVTQDMLDTNYPHPLLFDANAHYSHGDVVCLRILKERYFGAIRRNYLKTMAIHGRAVTRGKMAEMVQDDEHLGEAFAKQSIEVYTPDNMKGTEYSKDMFGAI